VIRVLSLAAVLAVVALKSPERSSSPGASLLRVVANDYAFTVASPPHAGLVVVRLVNRGHEMHHLELSPVPDSLSLRNYYELVTADQPSPLVHDVGGPNLTAPGDSSEVMLRLRPGRYILTCWVNAADGKPHLMRGMMAEIRVGQVQAELPPPIADAKISASDYKFVVDGQLRRGANVVAFENAGPQEHDIQFLRLTEGQSTSTVAEWAKRGGIGAPTRSVVGGTSGIDVGRRVWFTVTLDPGRYAIFCFVPDGKDGKMHLLHGMVREVMIR